jgi:NAD+ kinase
MKIALVIHPTRSDAVAYASVLAQLLVSADCEIFISNSSFLPANFPAYQKYSRLSEIDLIVVLGGDGTILRAAELCLERTLDHPPILGINLGSVGFLAEIAKPTPEQLADAILAGKFSYEKRATVDYQIHRNGEVVEQGFALNEVVAEGQLGQMVTLFLQVDGKPISRWGCDGVICATPTGSTAYAFSAGGPVLWPELPALTILPIAAHALFSRPLVVSANSKIELEVESKEAFLSADGMRKFNLQLADRIEIVLGSREITLAHLAESSFADRLVAKFKLPVEGWRG